MEAEPESASQHPSTAGQTEQDGTETASVLSEEEPDLYALQGECERRALRLVVAQLAAECL